MLASMKGTPVRPSTNRMALSFLPASAFQGCHHPGAVLILLCLGSVTSSNPPTVKSLRPYLREMKRK